MKLDEFLSYYHAEYISSRSNAKVVALGKLSDKKYRDKESVFLADGVKLAGEAVNYAHPEYLILAESALDTAAAQRTADSTKPQGFRSMCSPIPRLIKFPPNNPLTA